MTKTLRRALTPDEIRHRQFIIDLAKSFPSLRHLVEQYTPPTWDLDAFMAPLGALSSGERHAAIFVASVWNPHYAKAQGWDFHVMDALGTWDAGHRSAFLKWASNPYWP